MIGTALALARRGLHVFPCLPRRKEPATAHGCLDATRDPDTIRRWWRERPLCNVAVATGPASEVFVVDVDGLDAECELRKLEAEHGELPASVEVITARGRHIWLQYPDRPVKNTAGKIGPGIDTRGDRGYVLAPPSLHPSGKRYCWSVDSTNALAAAPSWLIEKIAAPATSAGTAAPIPPSEWRELTASINEGRRDDTLAKVTGHLLRRYVDPLLALELLHALNTARCTPPLPEEDVVRIVNSIAGRELRRRANGRG